MKSVWLSGWQVENGKWQKGETPMPQGKADRRLGILMGAGFLIVALVAWVGLAWIEPINPWKAVGVGEKYFKEHLPPSVEVRLWSDRDVRCERPPFTEESSREVWCHFYLKELGRAEEMRMVRVVKWGPFYRVER